MNGAKKMAMPGSTATREIVYTNIAQGKRPVKARMIRRIAEFAFHLLLALMGAFAVASWAVPAAYAERGYIAVGGEWLLVILTFCAVMYFCEVCHE